jgi:nucleoside 2-deoxyribosyltransferase
MSQTSCPLCGNLAEDLRPMLVSGKIVSCARCGRFYAKEMFFRQFPVEDPYLLAGAVRELNEKGVETVQLTNSSDVLSQVKVPRNPLEMMDRFLLSLRNRTERAGHRVILTEEDYPLAYCHDLEEWHWISGQMFELGLIEWADYEFRIMPPGWRRLLELSKVDKDSEQAFVAMSFHPDLDDIFNSGIAPAIVGTGYRPFRVDRNEHNERIDDLIISEIRRSGLLVADFTGQRNGVYFEAGFGLGLGLPVIWTCKDDEAEKSKLHFDTRQYNHIFWKDAQDLKEKLTNRIGATAPRR